VLGGGHMSTLKKIINWVKSRSVVLWILKVLFALLIGAISFLVTKTLLDVPTGALLTLASMYAYLGFQITHHTKARNKELMIFARMSIALIFLSIIASILGFIFVSKAFGWTSILILMFAAAYLILRLLGEAERDASSMLE